MFVFHNNLFRSSLKCKQIWWWCSIMSYPPQLHFHLSKLSRDFYSCKRREVYTNATYRNNYFGYLPYLCITCPLSWWRHFIYSHTNTICSEEGWDYLSVFPSCVALCPSLLRISHLIGNWVGYCAALDSWQEPPTSCKGGNGSRVMRAATSF